MGAALLQHPVRPAASRYSHFVLLQLFGTRWPSYCATRGNCQVIEKLDTISYSTEPSVLVFCGLNIRGRRLVLTAPVCRSDWDHSWCLRRSLHPPADLWRDRVEDVLQKSQKGQLQR